MSSRKNSFRVKLRGIALLGVVILLIVSFAAATASSWDVVASALDNPRGLAFGPDGALYVAEAGVGGPGPCISGPEGGEVCYGPSGAITRISNGSQARVLTGLPSLAGEDGSAAIGPTDVSFQGRVGYVIVGLGADPDARAELGDVGGGFGQLVQMTPNGKWRNFMDVAQYERDANPDGGEFDSNPYALVTRSGRNIIADAGANALLEVRKSRISTLAVFEDREVEAPPFLGLPPGTLIPMQSVPNAVTMGPDGAYYVGELTGFPFPVGGARVYRVVPGSAPEIFAEGFTNIIDLAFDPDGHLYVLEIAANGLLSGDITGALIRVESDGSLTPITVDGLGLVAPAGLAIGSNGDIYVSNFGIFAGGGEVVRIILD
jgi:sugar lactone lactonase YvrE